MPICFTLLPLSGYLHLNSTVSYTFLVEESTESHFAVGRSPSLIDKSFKRNPETFIQIVTVEHAEY